MLKPPYISLGVIVRHIDGDTSDIEAILPFETKRLIRIRLLCSRGGVDAYEMNDRDPALRAMAKTAHAKMNEMAPVGSEVLMETIMYKQDGFKRYLARLWNETNPDLGDVLIASGLAVPWVGRTNTEASAIRLALDIYKQRSFHFSGLRR